MLRWSQAGKGAQEEGVELGLGVAWGVRAIPWCVLGPWRALGGERHSVLSWPPCVGPGLYTGLSFPLFHHKLPGLCPGCALLLSHPFSHCA